MSVLLCLLLTAAVLPCAAQAAEGICLLEIEYLDGKEAIPGAGFRVWRAADPEPRGEYALTESFAGSGVKLHGLMNNGEWEDAAKTLSEWAEQNNIPAKYSGTTGTDGTLSFTGLSEGVYLVKGDPLRVGDDIYTPQIFCVVIPDRNAEGEPVYAVKAMPKFESETAPKTGGLTVSKTVTGSAGDKNRLWHFTVSLSDKTVNGRYGEMVFTDGAAEIALKHGQSAEALNLPAGIAYRVTEAEAGKDGYTTESAGAAGFIEAGGTATAEFTNSKAGSPGKPPQTGDDSSLYLWIMLAALSGAGLAGTSLAGHRRKCWKN